MPRIKGEWKKQNKTNWLILEKLIRKGPQNLPTLQYRGRPKLPHASVIKGIEYLRKRYLISQVAIDNSIPKKPIRTFDSTFLGQIVWFVEKMNNNKTTRPILSPTYFKKILPAISKNWNLLSKYYEVKHMEKLLAKVFSNIEILTEDPVTIKYMTFYRGLTMEFKNTQEHEKLDYTYDIVDSKEFKKGLETIVNFAFLLELYKLYDQNYYYYDEITGIIGKPNVNDWLNIVNNNRKFKEAIQIGFYVMKQSVKRTDEGLREDLNTILGKGKYFCQFCEQTYDLSDEKKHFNSHRKPKPNEDVGEYMKKFHIIDYLLNRSMFEYELDFQKDKVFKFNKFFKI